MQLPRLLLTIIVLLALKVPVAAEQMIDGVAGSHVAHRLGHLANAGSEELSIFGSDSILSGSANSSLLNSASVDVAATSEKPAELRFPARCDIYRQADLKTETILSTTSPTDGLAVGYQTLGVRCDLTVVATGCRTFSKLIDPCPSGYTADSVLVDRGDQQGSINIDDYCVTENTTQTTFVPVPLTHGTYAYEYEEYFNPAHERLVGFSIVRIAENGTESVRKLLRCAFPDDNPQKARAAKEAYDMCFDGTEVVNAIIPSYTTVEHSVATTNDQVVCLTTEELFRRRLFPKQ